jgi:hypothetical protein
MQESKGRPFFGIEQPKIKRAIVFAELCVQKFGVEKPAEFTLPHNCGVMHRQNFLMKNISQKVVDASKIGNNNDKMPSLG